MIFFTLLLRYANKSFANFIQFIMLISSISFGVMIKNPNAKPFEVPKDWSPQKYTSNQEMQSVYVNSFGSSLFNSLIKEESEGNVSFSPLSIHQALMMTANGASKETEAIFRNVLRLHDLPAEDSVCFRLVPSHHRVPNLLDRNSSSLYHYRKLACQYSTIIYHGKFTLD